MYMEQQKLNGSVPDVVPIANNQEMERLHGVKLLQLFRGMYIFIMETRESYIISTTA